MRRRLARRAGHTLWAAADRLMDAGNRLARSGNRLVRWAAR